MLRIYLLGGLRVTVDDHPLQIPDSPGLVGLWAFLLLHPRRPLDRSYVAFTLWPDVDEEKALAHLRRCLYHLQHLLPPAPADRPWLLIEGRTLRWNPDADAWLDVDQFRRDCADGAIEPLVQGLALYRGDLLPGVAGDWLPAERARLRLEYLAALERLIALRAADGDYAAALTAAQELFHQQPYSEAALRWCMRLRYLAGDRAAALRQYNEFTARLEQAGQISAETAALRERIVAGDELPPLARESPTAAQPDVPLAPAAPAPVARRGPRWMVLALAALLALAGAAIWIARPFHPRQTLTLAGPQLVQDTWILSSVPDATGAGDLDAPWLYVDLHDGRGLVNPHAPFPRYPAARLNLANVIVSDALLRFDLSQLPAHSRVESARLSLYLEPDNLCKSQQGWPPVTLVAYRLLRAWEADTATFSSPWAEPGLRPDSDYAPSPVDWQAVLGPGPLTLDLTAAMASWQSGHNYGIVLMVAEAPAGCSPYWMDTVEHPDPTRRPYLVIQYR
ncbi:MAG: BTAD domain-containing putative transcriptional regulator [Anaerolineae bacterium]